jgi:secreted trypsin-like serine protease
VNLETVAYSGGHRALFNFPRTLVTSSGTTALAATTGWGRNGYGGTAPCRRTAVPLRFVSGERCTRAQLDLGITPNPAWQLCALPTADATRNTCTGDSGSPVVATNTVWGLVTWGPSCRIDDVGVYARGPALTTWVARVLRGTA